MSKLKAVLLPGNGIGPEISESVLKIFDAIQVPIEWEVHQIHVKSVTESGDLISEDTINAIRNLRYGLKGPFETPIGKGFRSLNVTLRKRLKLYANVRPCISIVGIKNLLYNNVDLVTIRENTEGEYSGLEHVVVPGIVENLKIISKEACYNICKFAFEYAVKNGRKSVVCCHKAEVMKLGDGCFLNTCREVAKDYPGIDYKEIQVDTMCTKLVRNPSEVDVMVMPNLYGDILSDLCAGLIGGLGLTPSGNIGKDCSVFEAVHGTAPDIAGKGLANPTALLLSGCMMLDYISEQDLKAYSARIRKSVFKVLKEGKYTTKDLGGNSGTNDYTKAIIENL